MKQFLVANNRSYDGYLTDDRGTTTNTTIQGKKSSGDLENSLDDKATNKRCFSLGECERCKEHTSKPKATQIEGCGITGRREKFECVLLNGGAVSLPSTLIGQGQSWLVQCIEFWSDRFVSDIFPLSPLLSAEKEVKRFELYQPCKRTVADEEFLMVSYVLVIKKCQYDVLFAIGVFFAKYINTRFHVTSFFCAHFRRFTNPRYKCNFSVY